MNRFAGTVVALTGAAGGIGSRIADDFRAEGARVSCFDLVKPETARSEDLWTIGDVRSSDDVNTFIAATERTHSRIDVLVNCAGAVGRAPVHEISDTEWARMIEVNLTGTFRCTRAALGVLRNQEGGGVVINVASQAGVRVEPFMAHYSAAKAAVLQFTKSVALEYAPAIRCNSICPGLIKTPMVHESLSGYAAQAGISYEKAVEERRSVIPLQRFQSARNLSDGVLFLASPQASEITGTNLDVSGGDLIPR
ncbi:SDR family NAD(P)-dependent oxidoreductase [Actinomadura madurae]|uniref:SDR family NAD(P)-dependent oxidoreductase n=1 Tax=Actinomadura madurae TaxID=1993 RepID=UPI000D94A5E0|nr:SDR family oxidoreductase [Actinomadura madurae]SPT51239.1 2-(R)-hydroxypropyl-CoM dehydrogenase [Actinomadura madurae]